MAKRGRWRSLNVWLAAPQPFGLTLIAMSIRHVTASPLSTYLTEGV